MLQNSTYRYQSKAFLEKAYAELREGDLHQTSEKGWGAAAQILKAVAEECGWEHGTHRLLFQAAGTLTTETQSAKLRDGFGAASMLHVNFYEGWMDMASVELNLDRVREFVAEAEALLNGRRDCRLGIA